MTKRHSYKRMYLGEAIVTGFVVGIFLGVLEIWFGLAGGWASGKQLLLFGASIASGIAFGLSASLLNYLVGYRYRFFHLLAAPMVGGLAGFVFGLVYNHGAVSWGIAGLGAGLATLTSTGLTIEQLRKGRTA